eukprot:CAMPEP_0114671046 /NCGR_PEP_ID=MMETSP0191-20121206/40497_1 /TAXON_ID=126664 /ORGANISM="Sorites sp." /LENGTH=87 /DNA_ID=CAMNT_0001929959 /DNA_START=499 /DNA_END=762 /DNA_ORIENTATION=-
MTFDANFIIFARNNDLWITTANPDLLGDNDKIPNEVQLTFVHANNKHKTAGVCDFIMEEEFDRFTGYWVNDTIKKDIGLRILLKVSK